MFSCSNPFRGRNLAGTLSQFFGLLMVGYPPRFDICAGAGTVQPK
jgi:hypothetical protein